MVGIPQGSVLSTLLCSFFYGDLETRFFKFDEDPQSVNLPPSISVWIPSNIKNYSGALATC